jgi:hypothetical protein
MLCSGCAIPAPIPEPPIVITDVKPAAPLIPAGLLACAEEPVVPAGERDMEARANFIIDLGVAGRDCRAKLSAVRGLLKRD